MTRISRAALSSALIFPALILAACAPQTGAKDAQSESAQASASQDPSKTPAPTAVNLGKPITSALIDDLEDANNLSQESDQRGGYFYTYADESSTVEPVDTFKPAAGGPEGSQFAAQFKGKIGTQGYPYVGLGVSFTEPKAPYDASSCEGVAFMAKAEGEGTRGLRLKVGDFQTVPEGGLCQSCYNDFGETFYLTSEWKDYRIKFEHMTQEPYWGEPRTAIETQALYQLQWQVSEKGADFNIWIDNIRFIGCENAAEVEVPADEVPAPPASTEAAPAASGAAEGAGVDPAAPGAPEKATTQEAAASSEP